ncbi:uncharacterized protein LOC143301605 [Babylonia areolata]|uniref:uncharacterized protein LOC143301605 n=1 Tax=Babylonia areolata TaxID=304850 RepID=UPI003FD0F540
MRRGGRDRLLGVGRVAWVLHYLVLLLPLAMSMVSLVDSGVRRPPVYWNSSNTMFHSSNNDHVIHVNIGDTVDIICPHYSDLPYPSKSFEYYVIYMVDKIEYDTCVINDTSQKLKILNCSRPLGTNATSYTMLVLDFQPIQGIPDFHEGKSYYFISTSGGGEKEINNQYQGACYTDRMKIILRVIPRDNSKPATTRSPSTVTGGGGGGRQTPRTTPTTPTTTTTTPRPTSTTRRSTTSPFKRPTGKPGGGDGFPIDQGDNVIHVGGGGGDKNEGTITDSGAARPLSLSSPLSQLATMAVLVVAAVAAGRSCCGCCCSFGGGVVVDRLFGVFR